MRRRPLSARQLDVLDGACRGETTIETAARLRISVNTVRTHREALLAALDARTIAEAVHHAHEEGLLKPRRSA